MRSLSPLAYFAGHLCLLRNVLMIAIRNHRRGYCTCTVIQTANGGTNKIKLLLASDITPCTEECENWSLDATDRSIGRGLPEEIPVFARRVFDVEVGRSANLRRVRAVWKSKEIIPSPSRN